MEMNASDLAMRGGARDGVAVGHGLMGPGPAERGGPGHSPDGRATDYDMRTFIAPLPLNETELKGRGLFAQRCANCHGGTAQSPGPLLGGRPSRGWVTPPSARRSRRDRRPCLAFKYSLEPAQIDQITAFLKTFTPPRTRQPRRTDPALK